MSIEEGFDYSTAVEPAGTVAAVWENFESGLYAGRIQRGGEKFALIHGHGSIFCTVNEKERRGLSTNKMNRTGRPCFFRVCAEWSAE